MLKLLGIAAVSFVGGIGIAVFMQRAQDPGHSTINGFDVSVPVVDAAHLSDSLQTLRAETEARLVRMDERLTELAEDVRALRTDERDQTLGAQRPTVMDPEALARRLATAASIVDSLDSARETSARQDEERLFAAGFTRERIEWIERRRQELQMDESLNRYQALQGDAPQDANPLRGMIGPELALREEIGQAEYERYREALGQPTAVTVGRVLANSPAEHAGLRSDDEVIAYDGQRVYSPFEIDVLALEGTPGESVIVDIRRDGQVLQLVLPRGPTGISGTPRERTGHILMR